MTSAMDRDRLIRRNRRVGFLTLAFVGLVLAVEAITGDHLAASTWTVLALITLTGVGQVFMARLTRLGELDQATAERRERRVDSAAVMLAVGLPLVALLAVVVLVGMIVLR
jgi:hypothetical protein